MSESLEQKETVLRSVEIAGSESQLGHSLAILLEATLLSLAYNNMENHSDLRGL